jgi:hypothetical protein
VEEILTKYALVTMGHLALLLASSAKAQDIARYNKEN